MYFLFIRVTYKNSNDVNPVNMPTGMVVIML